MQYDTRSSTLIARMLMSEVIAEELLGARVATLSPDDAAKMRANITASFRELIDQVIASVSKNSNAFTAILIAELPSKRDAILQEVLAIGASPAAPPAVAESTAPQAPPA